MMENEVITAASEMDIAWNEGIGETRESAIAEVEERFGVTGRVVQEVGPGGGWPVVRFEGPRDNVIAFERWYLNPELP